MRFANKDYIIEDVVFPEDISSQWSIECQELANMNQRILLCDFASEAENRNCDFEYRILDKITCTNKHFEKLTKRNAIDYKKNRYDYYRPFEHSAVEIRANQKSLLLYPEQERAYNLAKRHSSPLGVLPGLCMGKTNSAIQLNVKEIEQGSDLASPNTERGEPSPAKNPGDINLLLPSHKSSGDDQTSKIPLPEKLTRNVSAHKRDSPFAQMNIINETDEKSCETSPLKLKANRQEQQEAFCQQVQDIDLADPLAKSPDFDSDYPLANPPRPMHRGSLNQPIGKGIRSLMQASELGCFTPSGDPSYINASYIHHPFLKNLPRAQIITQAPKSNTIEDFWCMVWENDVRNIVMLCSYKEKGLFKDERYFPSKGETASFGKFVVSAKEANKDGFQKSIKLEVRNLEKLETRVLSHFTLVGWEDKGAFDSAHYIRYVEFIRSVQRAQSAEKQNSKPEKNVPPLLIHCKAGVGRSGVFAASCFIYEYLSKIKEKYGNVLDDKDFVKDKNLGISIFATVRKMRESRWGLVMLPKQLFLLYEVTAHMIKHFDDL